MICEPQVDAFWMKTFTITRRNGQAYEVTVDDDTFEQIKHFKWRVQTRRRNAYVTRHAEKKTIRLHRYVTGASAGQQVDHIDGNGLNNCRSNLRLCDASNNLKNQRTRVTPKSSQFKGVSLNKKSGKYLAYISRQGRMVYLGVFATELEAAHAYDAAALAEYGEFARPNFRQVNAA